MPRIPPSHAKSVKVTIPRVKTALESRLPLTKQDGSLKGVPVLKVEASWAAPLPGVFAAIDLGSSSAKILIERVKPDGTMETVLDLKIGTGLGRGIGADHRLPHANQQRALDAVSRFVEEAARFGIQPQQIHLVATAVVRNTANGDEFAGRLKTELDLGEVTVLSGEEEALLGYLGAISPSAQGPGQFATLDLGGGSFQLAIGDEASMEHGASTQVGSNLIQEQLLPAGIITAGDFARADTQLKNLAPMPIEPSLLQGRQLVATGGISKFLRAHFQSDVVTREQIGVLREQLGSMEVGARGSWVQSEKSETTLQALGIGTAQGAQDYGQKLPASSTLLLHIMECLGLNELRLSEADARHAMVRRMAEQPPRGWPHFS